MTLRGVGGGDGKLGCLCGEGICVMAPATHLGAWSIIWVRGQWYGCFLSYQSCVWSTVSASPVTHGNSKCMHREHQLIHSLARAITDRYYSPHPQFDSTSCSCHRLGQLGITWNTTRLWTVSVLRPPTWPSHFHLFASHCTIRVKRLGEHLLHKPADQCAQSLKCTWIFEQH